ncbi:MAG TPA: DNA polymerase IV [Trueperaceae bacterium]|nr:DNA polymerase IV [Trueperaceae bacterium]
MRKIVHVDMDAFFASVEQRDRPELRGRPVAVGGTGPRAVVAAASYEARAFGVRSAMPMARALRACPELLVVRPRFDVYREVSQQVRQVFLRYTDLVEPLALDEAYLDVTHPKRGPPSATLIARAIKEDVKRETGLTASAGVSSGKFLAKLACGLSKPDGLNVIEPDQAAAILMALPVERFHGVGPRTAEKLRGRGWRTGADLQAAGRPKLEAALGKLGAFLDDIVNGLDERPVVPNQPRKSIGSETTFDKDIEDDDALDTVLLELCEDVMGTLDGRGMSARRVTVKIRFDDFRTVTRSHTEQVAFCRLPELVSLARRLAFEADRPRAPVRLLGVAVAELSERDGGVVQPRIDFGGH